MLLNPLSLRNEPPMDAFLADLIVVLHFAIVVFMVSGVLAVLVGKPLGWNWIRNPWWRSVHLAIMGYIAFNAARSKFCFLTIWERDLRAQAGQQTPEDMSFIARVFRDMLYVNIPQDRLNVIYLAVAGLVFASTFLVWPDFRKRRSE